MTAGLPGVMGWLQQHSFGQDHTLTCMEHTGMYSDSFISWLLDFNGCLW
jgi:hypothetical protein